MVLFVHSFSKHSQDPVLWQALSWALGTQNGLYLQITQVEEATDGTSQLPGMEGNLLRGGTGSGVTGETLLPAPGTERALRGRAEAGRALQAGEQQEQRLRGEMTGLPVVLRVGVSGSWPGLL